MLDASAVCLHSKKSLYAESDLTPSALQLVISGYITCLVVLPCDELRYADTDVLQMHMTNAHDEGGKV